MSIIKLPVSLVEMLLNDLRTFPEETVASQIDCRIEHGSCYVYDV